MERLSEILVTSANKPYKTIKDKILVWGNKLCFGRSESSYSGNPGYDLNPNCFNQAQKKNKKGYKVNTSENRSLELSINPQTSKFDKKLIYYKVKESSNFRNLLENINCDE